MALKVWKFVFRLSAKNPKIWNFGPGMGRSRPAVVFYKFNKNSRLRECVSGSNAVAYKLSVMGSTEYYRSA